jgi:proteasome lid subunit RPN8/RPN11
MKPAEVWTLPAAVRRAVVAQAKRERPSECCGFLVGRGRRVSHAVAMINAAPGRTRYRIADRDHIGLRRELRRFTPALENVGVYHSHPAGAAAPSATDLTEAHYAEWLYLIVGLRSRTTMAGFRIVAGRASRVRLTGRAR